MFTKISVFISFIHSAEVAIVYNRTIEIQTFVKVYEYYVNNCDDHIFSSFVKVLVPEVYRMRFVLILSLCVDSSLKWSTRISNRKVTASGDSCLKHSDIFRVFTHKSLSEKSGPQVAMSRGRLYHTSFRPEKQCHKLVASSSLFIRTHRSVDKNFHIYKTE